MCHVACKHVHICQYIIGELALYVDCCLWVMSHVWMRHVSAVNESRPICECVMSRVYTSHTKLANRHSMWTAAGGSCLTCEWVMSHLWLSHVSHVNESCRMCTRHIQNWWVGTLCGLLLVNRVCLASCLTCECIMSHIWKSYVAVYTCLLSTWQIGTLWGLLLVIHVSLVNESCLTREWVMSHLWMSHVSHVNGSCLSREWVMSHTWMGHVSHVKGACLSREWVMSHTWMSHVM